MKASPPLPAAVIFDMDGVLVDSNPFHLQKWIEFLSARDVPFKVEELPKLILGQRNDTALRHFLGSDLTRQQSRSLSEELERQFRKVFRSHARPLPGLTSLLDECYSAGLPMAVASSAMSKNVELVVEVLSFRRYFRFLISGDEVVHPKPDPEIYLGAAERVGVDPAGCVAFEDSFVGVEAAKRAGMKCVAIASTFPLEELREQTRADLVVRGFEELSLERLRQLF